MISVSLSRVESGIIIENFVIWNLKCHLLKIHHYFMYHQERKYISKRLLVFISYLLKTFRLRINEFPPCHTHAHAERKWRQAKWAKGVAIPPVSRFSQKQVHKVSNCEFHCFQSRKLKKKKGLINIIIF